MDRKTLVAGARASGWKGSTLAELLDWQDGPDGCDFFEADGRTPVDIEKAWGTKARLTLDAGEVINDLTVEAAEQPEQMADDMEDEEDVAKTRRPTVRERQNAAAKRRLGEVHAKASDDYRISSTKGINSPEGMKRLQSRKQYDRAVSGKGLINVPGHGMVAPAFADSEVAEHLASYARLTAMGWRDYPLKAWDRDVVGKANVTYDNDLGGNWAAEAWSNDIIELKNSYGAVRAAGGSHTMTEAVEWVARFGDDVAVGDITENSAIDTTQIGTGRVQLTAETSGCIAKISNNLLQDSRVNVGDAIGRSISRASARFEDTLCLRGTITVGSNTYTREGIQGKIDTNSKHDAALATDWSDLAIGDINTIMGKLPAWAYELGAPKFIGSLPFYHQNLMRFANAAGGNTGADLKSGFVTPLQFQGFEYIVANVMPQTYSGNQYSLYFGVLGLCTKLGDYGGMQIKTSEDRYFDENNFAIRGVWRWAWNPHDVGGGTDGDGITKSGIIALQD